jgi:hypothetical protein
MGALGTRRKVFLAARPLRELRALAEILAGRRALEAGFLTATFLRGLDTLARRRLAFNFSFLPAGLRATFLLAVADFRRAAAAVLPFRPRTAFRTLALRVRVAGRLAARTARFLAGRLPERLRPALPLAGFLAMDAAFLRAPARLDAGFALRLTARPAPGLRRTSFLLPLFAVLFFFAIPHPTSDFRLIW